MSGYRLRVRYRKAGRLRFLSHLETGRACERSVRRAGLPYAVTQGYNPRMRIAFGPALPVGTASEAEYYDVVLTEYVPPRRALDDLASRTVEELAPTATGYVNEREPSLAAALTIARYEVRVAVDPDELGKGIEEVLAQGELTVEHKGRQKVFDLTEVLPKRPEVSSCEDGACVTVTVRMGQAGSLRPDVLVKAALVRSGVDAPATLVTRTDLYVEEGSGWRRPL
ncbi:MAG: TIGR03936 family radical SAM-associated protein [Coriobacteriia bacterium]